MSKKAARAPGYEKISATLEAPVLRQIRDQTTNVSGFLNDAAKRKLYFDRLAAFSEEMRRRGVVRDERLYRGLLKLADQTRARQRARSGRQAG